MGRAKPYPVSVNHATTDAYFLSNSLVGPSEGTYLVSPSVLTQPEASCPPLRQRGGGRTSFLIAVTPDAEHWIWQGNICTTTGYGRIAWGGTTYRAHRVAYEAFRGPIPAGYSLDHQCRVRECCNPWCVEPTTRAENCRKGAQAKLNHDMADEIRALYATRLYEQEDLARVYGVSRGAISAVLRNVSWVREIREDLDRFARRAKPLPADLLDHFRYLARLATEEWAEAYGVTP